MSSNCFGVFFALGGIGELFVRHILVEVVMLIARKNVEVVMEGVLATCGLVVLQCRDTVAPIRLFHGDRDFFRNIENVDT